MFSGGPARGWWTKQNKQKKYEFHFARCRRATFLKSYWPGKNGRMQPRGNHHHQRWPLCICDSGFNRHAPLLLPDNKDQFWCACNWLSVNITTNPGFVCTRFDCSHFVGHHTNWYTYSMEFFLKCSSDNAYFINGFPFFWINYYWMNHFWILDIGRGPQSCFISNGL